MKLILASASPRRAQLLEQAGYAFEIEPADINENGVVADSPSELAQRLALAKAELVSERYPDDVVLGADTIVCLGEEVLGKPADADDARRMLELLSGTTQIVITGLALLRQTGDYQQITKVFSAVRMDNLTQSQIDEYVASGEWQGKAGGYGIQDHDPLVQRISGSMSNVVGLPMETVQPMLERAGISPGKSE